MTITTPEVANTFPDASESEIVGGKIMEQCDHKRAHWVTSQVRRALKPGGMFRLDASDGPPPHWDALQLATMLEACGFAVTRNGDSVVGVKH
jgi:hypothetical protein